MRYKCLQWLVVCGIFVCLGPALVSAHGVVGKRKFIEPFVAEDANPKDEFVLAKPGHFNLKEGNTFSVRYVLEKRFSKKFSLAHDPMSRGEKSPASRSFFSSMPRIPRPDSPSVRRSANDNGCYPMGI